MNPADIPASAKSPDLVWIGGKPCRINSQAMVESTYTDRNGKLQTFAYNAVSVDDLPEWHELRQPHVTTTRKGDHLERFRASGRMAEQHAKILAFLRTNSLRAWTRQELAKKLEMPINVVCPRVHELIQAQRVSRAGNQRCTVTGQTVEGVTIA